MKRKVVHEIRDRAGNVAAIHVRTDKGDGTKGFAWRRPGDLPGLGGIRVADLPLFGAELLDAGGPVVVVEGEKAALALRSLGVLALGTVTGAGVVPSNQVLADLRGRDVILWPDHDTAGRAHMRRLSETLQGIARSVRMISWGTQEGDDAADFVSQGGTKEGLERLAPFATSLVPESFNSAPTKPCIPFIRIGDLLREPDPEFKWIVDGRLQVGGISLLVAKPKVGKSTLARGLCIAVSRGEPWLGHETKKGPVAYCGFEEIRSEVKKHFGEMGATDDEDLFVFSGLPSPGFLEQLRDWILAKRPVLVVLDGLFRLVRVLDGNDYATMSRALEPIIQLARDCGAHLLLTHHSPKSERGGGDDVLGSTAILGSVDTLLKIRRSDRGERSLSTDQRYGRNLEETLLILGAGGRSELGASREGAELEKISGEILDALTRAPACGWMEPEIVALTVGKTGQKRQAVRQLVEAGFVVRTGTGRRGSPFYYSLPGPAGETSEGSSLVPAPDAERENENVRPENRTA